MAELFGLLAAAVVPAVMPMLQDMAAGGRRRRRSDSDASAEAMPAPKRRRVEPVVPCELGELEPCFAAFERETGITLDPFIVAFARLSFTPDVIPFVPFERLQDVTEHTLAEGVLHKLRVFCKRWYNTLSHEKEDEEDDIEVIERT